jgi:predicted aspartyl protease
MGSIPRAELGECPRALQQDHGSLPIRVTVGQRTFEGEALVDTGFDDDFAIQHDKIANGAPPDEYRTFRLTDGSRVVAAIYYGRLQIGDLPAVDVDVSTVGDEPLLGRGETVHYRMIFDHGRTLTAEPLRRRPA